jgi:redox-sensitive bicupin YhaK (pirin superfamily)
MKILLVIKEQLVSILHSLLTSLLNFVRQVTGGVQWMCAGKGIIHAEMPIHVPGSPDPRGLQLWVDLPKQVHFK